MRDLEAIAPTPRELPVYARLDLEIVSGDGVVVTTSEGRELLDFYGGHAAALLGYRHPRLLAALSGQAERLFFQTNAVELAVRERAARAVVALAPAGLERVFFVNSGAEANENALRLACAATGRPKVVALEGSFHGRTGGAGAVSWGATGSWYGFPRTPFDVRFVPPDDEAALEAALDDSTAALILEAVQGIAGARDLDLGYLHRARELTRQRGAWLLADEVQCGMGRTGRPFAFEAAGIVPDLVTVAKGLAGGFPAAAMLAPEELAERLGPGDLGSTFGGGPLAAALIEVVAETLRQPGFLERVADLGEEIRETCRVGPVEAVQGRGLLLGLRTRPPAREVLAALLERGILAGGARDPHVVRLMPPLVVERSHVAVLRDALAAIGRSSQVVGGG